MQALRVFILTCGLASLASAQLTSSGPAPAERDSLLIGPGDLLHFQVFNTPELEQHPRVTVAGDAPLEFLGNVHLSGMTPAEAARTVEDKLMAAKLVLHPQVTVTVEQFATQNVSVLGEVHTPGTYQITVPRDVLDVIAMAGGLNSVADRTVTIKRHGQDGEKISYFLSNNSNAAFDASVLVYPGDTLLIPKAGLVYVLGDVRNPGGYVMDDNRSQLTVLQIVATAGGTNKSAVPAHARLIRKQPDGTFADMSLQLSKMQKGKQPDLPLQAGDIVYVPFSYLRNMAVGAQGIAASVAGASVYNK
jgi:polysaccharide export outer membrane protein